MSKLPPWQLRPVDGCVTVLLPPPPATTADSSRADAVVVQGAFTRHKLPDSCSPEAECGAAAEPEAAGETFQLVVCSRRQTLRLLVSHRRRPLSSDYPMGEQGAASVHGGCMEQHGLAREPFLKQLRHKMQYA